MAGPADEHAREPVSAADWVLGALFAALVVGSAAALAYDFRTLQASAAGSPFAPETAAPARYEPGPPPLPGRDEQVRRYDPNTAPARRSGATVDLPGFEGDADAALAAPMTFHSDGAGTVSAVGRITLTTYADFETFLAGDLAVERVVLHSPGGSVRDAMGMALMIRDMGADTVVPANGYCASSCPLVFAGGVTRAAGDPAWLGVHQVFTLEGTAGTVQDGMEGAQYVSSQAQQLLDDMGVDPRAWIHAMATPPDRLYVFSSEELASYQWTTDAR